MKKLKTIKFGTNKPILDPEDWTILNKLLRFEELMCKFSDVLEALESTGHKNLLKKINEPIKEGDEKNWTVHCLAEDYLCDHFFLSYSKNKIFTSATIGNKNNSIKIWEFLWRAIKIRNYIKFPQHSNLKIPQFIL